MTSDSIRFNSGVSSCTLCVANCSTVSTAVSLFNTDSNSSQHHQHANTLTSYRFHPPTRPPCCCFSSLLYSPVLSSSFLGTFFFTFLPSPSSLLLYPLLIYPLLYSFLSSSVLCPLPGRIGSVTAQFVNGTLQNNVKVLLLVTSSCMILGGGFSLLLPVDRSGVSLTDFTEELEKKDSRRDILTPEMCVGEGMEGINPILDYPFSTSSGLKSGKKLIKNSNNQKTVSDRTYNVIPISECNQ